MVTSSVSVVDGAVSHVDECGLEVASVEEIPPARTQASVSRTGREAIGYDGSESVEQAIDRGASQIRKSATSRRAGSVPAPPAFMIYLAQRPRPGV